MHRLKSAKLVDVLSFGKLNDREALRQFLANSSHMSKWFDKQQNCKCASKVHQTCLLFFYLASMHVIHGKDSANIFLRELVRVIF